MLECISECTISMCMPLVVMQVIRALHIFSVLCRLLSVRNRYSQYGGVWVVARFAVVGNYCWTLYLWLFLRTWSNFERKMNVVLKPNLIEVKRSPIWSYGSASVYWVFDGCLVYRFVLSWFLIRWTIFHQGEPAVAPTDRGIYLLFSVHPALTLVL